MNEYYYGITDRGRLRENNEDAFVAQQVRGSESVIAAVIDGVGGYEGGEVAAGIAKNRIETLLTSPITDLPGMLKQALYDANKHIIEQKELHRGRENMACVLTLAVADIANNQFHYAHVGDTRLYLLRGQSLIKVTKDHSFVGFLEDSSRITETDAMQHPKRNEINKALGFDPTIPQQPEYVETGTSPFLPGDILVLCSDGLTDMISRQQITDILCSGVSIQAKAQLLVEAANKAGGKDNITVVLVQHPRARQEHQPTLPVTKTTENAEAKIPRNPGQNTSSHRGAHPAIVWMLLLACIGLTAALVWQMNRPRSTPTTDLPGPMPPVVHTHSAAQQQLIDSINNSSATILLDSSSFRSPILITDSIVINKDSFRLLGNGIVLRRDTTQHGPAIILPPNARYIVLDNIVFENFPVAIVANNNALRLSNVRFLNCQTPLAYQLHLTDGTYTNGVVNGGLFFRNDSLPENHKAWQ